jgi:hypothetical protein
MDPTQQTLSREQKMEILRRRAEMPSSTAGFGAPSANAPTSPIAESGTATPNQPSIPGGAGGVASDGTIKAMKSQKGEAEKLTDAMIWRQKKLTEQGK